MTPKELAQYAKVCRKYGITELKVGDVSFKLELEPQAQLPTQSLPELPLTATPSMPDAPTEEQVLYWSSGSVA